MREARITGSQRKGPARKVSAQEAKGRGPRARRPYRSSCAASQMRSPAVRPLELQLQD